ncbi:uncharacterized protein TrAtP1_011952 [Trichoderma atroviride]|uniref:uncharacterized protein n=1 Tax=Hypocrea atroviridis TaxID=63577 RepID=UPI0033286D30|nr:hypothetical protein TrAtP1_011952 [Trichoderma atroviride]
MHLLEAAGLHLEGCSAEQPPPPSGDRTLVVRRKLYAIGCHFNLWMSFELGRTRVKLPTATTKLPLADLSNEQGKRDIFSFLALSESLDYEHRQSVPELEQTLLDIMSIQDLAAPMVLTQCNLMLCVIRRLQYLGLVLSGSVLDGFAQVARQGLRATRQNVVGHSPWHQVANVPFQIICTLLSMDNQVAMGLLPDAVQTLREVATAYNTDVMREASSTAILLVKMHQRRKEQDAKALNDIVMAAAAAAAAADDAESRNTQITNEAASAALLQNDSLASDSSAQWWPQDSFLGLGLEGLPLDPLLMMQDSWPAPTFG